MTTALDARPSRFVRLAQASRSYGVVIALVVLVIAISVAQPSFLSFPNQMNILSQWAPVAIMGIGMTYVVITGGFDLSVGATYALAAVVAAAIGQSQPPVVAFSAAIAAGLVVGVVNGFIVTALRVNPFIATLGTSLVVGGITLAITGNKAFIVAFEPFTALGRDRLAGVPYSGILVIVLFVIAGLVLAYTSWGQSVYAVGGNLEASRLAGIRTSGVVGSAYAIAGLTAGVAGVVTASQLSSAQASLGATLVFDVLTVVIVGGTALSGGRGAIWRTAVGVGILATLQNGFNLLDIDAYYQDVIKGVIIIAALATLDRGGARHLRRLLAGRGPSH
ncbi:ABC transporter permease [Yonghaparkia sp. Root332]|uniref:ABC transporter permease n=1 Tax=Yonghaparkia sp. Root332 TaxID=1736516 RepID=UPI000A6B22BB|nr:ABC transporter permease [Yonghaparkia sp. Root332]